MRGAKIKIRLKTKTEDGNHLDTLFLILDTYRTMGKTLFDKIWDSHVVKSIDNGPNVLYIDRHFIHEVTSPQAFAGIKARGGKVARPDQVVAPTLPYISPLLAASP